jgi:hypothetical protein
MMREALESRARRGRRRGEPTENDRHPVRPMDAGEFDVRDGSVFEDISETTLYGFATWNATW